MLKTEEIKEGHHILENDNYERLESIITTLHKRPEKRAEVELAEIVPLISM